MIRRIISVVVALALALTMAVITAGPAQARRFCDEAPPYRPEGHVGATHYHASYDHKWCTTIRRGPDKWAVKSMQIGVGYRVTHYLRHPSQWCFPYGDLDYYIFTLKLTNAKTGYSVRRNIKVDCNPRHPASGGNYRILTHMPLCTVPVHYDGGRNPTPYRRYCRLALHVERVMKGPDPNGFDTFVRRHVIRR